MAEQIPSSKKPAGDKPASEESTAAAAPPSDAAAAPPVAPAADAAPAEAAPAAAAPTPTATSGVDEAAEAAKVEELLKEASFEDPAAAANIPAPEAESFNLPSFQQVVQDAQVSSIEMLRDVELSVKIELGRSRMLVEDVLKLAEGSVVELDKLAGDPVDVFVNERLVARGEVLVLNDNFCVRVNEIVSGGKEEVA